MRGIDLAAEFRSRRWRRLLGIIERLPRDSQMSEAMANDDEFARMVADNPVQPPSGPRISEWNGIRDDLAAVIDRLGNLTQAVIASAGSKPPKIKPYPRPKTAGDRIKSQERKAKHEALVALIKG